jgi:hypothetical protein
MFRVKNVMDLWLKTALNVTLRDILLMLQHLNVRVLFLIVHNVPLRMEKYANNAQMGTYWLVMANNVLVQLCFVNNVIF